MLVDVLGAAKSSRFREYKKSRVERGQVSEVVGWSPSRPIRQQPLHCHGRSRWDVVVYAYKCVLAYFLFIVILLIWHFGPFSGHGLPVAGISRQLSCYEVRMTYRFSFL